MNVFELNDEANRLVLSFVQSVRDDVRHSGFAVSIDEKTFRLFLSDVEHELKFLAVRLANARGADVAGKSDVENAMRKLRFELLRKRRNFSVHRRICRDLDVVKQGTKSSENLRILDAGCGWGRASKWFFELVDKRCEVVGIDLDVFSLKYGKSLNRDFSFLRAHMAYLPFKLEVFDVILASKSLHEVEGENYKRASEGFVQALRHHGILYITDSFARFCLSKFIQRFLHRLFPKIEVHPQLTELEMNLTRSGFKVVKKGCFAYSMFGLNRVCSCLARKVGC